MAILFADIIGCSEVSNHKKLSEYNDFLHQFHSIFDQVAEDHRDSFYADEDPRYFKWSTRGDEGCLMIFYPGREEDVIARDLDTCVNIALDLKRRWLLGDENKQRIEGPGLLPIDLAVGIHMGKAYVNENPGGTPQPEGYAINLTKRIESASRGGQSTHIYVSAAAHGALDRLTDEATYTFGPMQEIPAKGILHGARVFEVRHHFLATDWTRAGREYRKTRALDFEPSDEDVRLARQAHHENPTNIWLAEEYIKLKLLSEYSKLKAEGEEGNPQKLKESYDDAKRVCRRLTSGDQREAELLGIAGFIAGEYEEYEEEQRLYREALRMNDQYAEGHWYLGLSMSYQLSDRLEDEGKGDVKYDDLSPEEQGKVNDIQECLRRAIELKPQQPWMSFDLAAEMARWSADKSDAIRELEHAYALNSIVRYYIADDPYFSSIIDHPRVKKLLPDQTS